MNNSRLKNGTIFMVAAILVAGTFSYIIPASFAQPYYADPYADPYTKDPYAKDYREKGEDVNVQKIKCNNIIVNGVDKFGQKPRGDMLYDMTDEYDEISPKEGQWLGNGYEKKLTDIEKNIVNVCVNTNNIVIVQEEPPFVPETCEDCFSSTNVGGPVSPNLLTLLNEFLATNPVVIGNAVGQIVGDVEGLCNLIEVQNEPNNPESDPGTVEQIELILNEAWGDNTDEDVVQEIIDCLLDLGLIVETPPP